MSAIFLALNLGLQFVLTLSWNLKHFAPSDAPLGQVAVWRNRAFLSLPRYETGTIKATLIEDVWPDIYHSQEPLQQVVQITYQGMTTLPRAYPKGNLALQKEGYCSALQNVTALDIDSMRGRLWVLDSGTAVCWSKVVVFDLRKNEELWRTEMRNVSSGFLASIIADPLVGKWGPRAYVGVRNSRTLIVVETRMWWPLRLESKRLKSGITLDVVVETLALSRREPILYMTASNSDLMFSLNMSAVRASPPPGRNVYRTMCVTFLGYKLGPSRGLVMDLWSGLHYFLSRDHAAVRWDTRRHLSAESHSILLQSAKKLPFVSHMFLGPQWQVWAVVGQHCVRIQKYSFI